MDASKRSSTGVSRSIIVALSAARLGLSRAVMRSRLALRSTWDVLAMCLSTPRNLPDAPAVFPTTCLRGFLVGGLAGKRNVEVLHQRLRFGIGLGRGHEHDVHAAHRIDL